MTSKNDVLAYIWKIETDAEIKELWALLKKRRGQLSERNASQFKVGQDVSFEHRGSMVKGKVTKINIKTVGVKTETIGEWRVHPNCLTAID